MRQRAGHVLAAVRPQVMCYAVRLQRLKALKEQDGLGVGHASRVALPDGYEVSA